MTEVAPSFDKVGPESSGGPNGKPSNLVAAVTTKMAQQNHLSDGPNHIGVTPKPVEVTSVPETPVNGAQTPVGGTPRPELKITEDEPEQKEAPKEAPVILGPNSEEKVSAPEPVSDLGGPDKASQSKPAAGATETGDSTPLGEKRKVEEEKEKPATKDEPENQDKPSIDDSEERPEKKAKVTDKIIDTVVDLKDKVESKVTNGKKKPGRPKKDKTAPPPVGKTQRKTRSQGPID